MTTDRKQFRKTALAIAATLALGAAPTHEALAGSNCTWNPATGNWGTAGNWSCGVVPTGPASDNATIGAGKTVTVNTAQSIFGLVNVGSINIDAFLLSLQGGGSTTNTGTINVGSGVTAALQVQGGHNLTNTGGVINIANGSAVNQFGSVITGGTINSTGTGALFASNSGSNFLNGVTLNGALDMSGGTGIERLSAGGMTLNGTIKIGRNSIFASQGTQTIAGTGNIVFADAFGSNRLNVEAGDLTLGSGVTIHGNTGYIGQQAFVGGAATLTNNGTISADVSGGTITLAVNGTVTNNGTLSARNGGTLLLNNSIAGGVGSQIVAGAGSTVLQNGVALNGTIDSSGGAGSFRASNSGSNIFNGVNFSGVLDLAAATGIERVVGGLVLNGTVNIAQNSVFAPQGDQTISGTGSIVFADGSTSNRLNVEAGNLVLGSGITVRGNTGYIGQQSFLGGAATLTNNGTVSADVSGGTITLAVNGPVFNNGTLSALNGGTLLLNSNVQGNAGSQILAGAGSTVVQNGVALTGAINTTGSGTFRASNNGSNFFDGVGYSGTLDLASATGIERVRNGLALSAATINIGQNSVFAPQGDQTISGTGSIVFTDGSASNRLNVEAGNLVLGSGITVRGNTGYIGQQSFLGGAATLTNNGTIRADVAGGTITLAVNGGVTNNGSLSALNGGTLLLSSNVQGNSGSQILAGAGSTVVQNGVTLTGAINTTGGGSFRASNSGSNFFDGVTYNGTLDLASATGIERTVNGLTLSGATINIGQNSVFASQGDQTIGGTGSIVFANDGSGSNRFNVEAGNLILGSGITLRGGSGLVGPQGFVGGAATLTNRGVISADVAATTIQVAVNGAVINQGTMRAQNGGTLILNPGGGYDNTAGVMLADTGSVVQQNAAVITGGALNSNGSGAFRASASGSNFLNGVTLNGVLDMGSVQGIERISAGGMTLNGTIKIGNHSVLAPQGNQTLGGTGSIVFTDASASNRLNVEAGNLVIGSGVTVRGQTGVIGQQSFVGGAATLTNNGTINADAAGTISVNIAGALTNNGTMRAQNGTLSIGNGLLGTGTLQADAAGTINLSNAASTQGRLLMGAAGSTLNIGTQNLTITNDYTNAAAGVGNSFDRRAGVSGTGLIVAGSNAAQAITGSGVTGGNTANATLAIGNVRVGATTFNYQVANTGSTGPSLRGAIQTNVNGANLSDARLSGSGVTASNYNTGAPGHDTGNLAVTFTAANAGALSPLVGQVLNLRSNFGNIVDQKLNVVLLGGANAYNAAVGNASSPVQIANQRINGSNSAVLTVANSAPLGGFSEDLNASFGGATGAASGSGSILGRLAGTNNTGSGAISVGVDTSAAGAKTGGVTLNYQTAGAVNGVSNGLGTASVGSQVVSVNGNVYKAAAGAIQTAALNFGTVQVGQAVSRDLVVRNIAAGPNGFVEDLNASFGSTSGTGAARISGTGGLSGILAGTNSTAGNGVMTVAVNTFAAGVVNGGIAVNYFTAGAVNGVTNGLGTAAVGSETYAVAGTIQAVANVINQAAPLVNTPVINFGAMRVGDTGPTAQVSVTNQATTPPQAALNASISSGGAPVTANGSFNLLAPGSTSTNQLVVGLSTANAGNFTGANAGSATIAFVSDANNVGNCAPNCQLNLASQQVSVTGKVYAPAVAQVDTNTVDFGIVHRGDVVAAKNVAVSNTAAVAGLNDTLRGSIGGATAPFTASGTLLGVAAQGSDATSFSVGLNTATAGVFNGSATASFASHDGDLADLDLGASAIALKGQVNNFAEVAVTKSGAGQFSLSNHTYTLDFGTIALGSSDLSASLAVLNGAIGPADLLGGDFDLTGVGPGFTLSGFGSFAGLIAGDAFGGLSVVFASDTQGAFLSSLVLHAHGSNASGYLGQLDDTTLVLRGNVGAVVAVPEPGTYVLMFAGLLVVVGTTRARRRSAQPSL